MADHLGIDPAQILVGIGGAWFSPSSYSENLSGEIESVGVELLGRLEAGIYTVSISMNGSASTSVQLEIAPAIMSSSQPSAIGGAPFSITGVGIGSDPEKVVVLLNGSALAIESITYSGVKATVTFLAPNSVLGVFPLSLIYSGVASDPIDLSIISNDAIQSVQGGAYHTCMVLVSAGSLKCWGYNNNGELGVGTNLGGAQKQNVSVADASVNAVALAVSSTCALIQAGNVYCWGNNAYDQLGYYTNASPSYLPRKVSGLANITAITAGFNFFCALDSNGDVWCWGLNLFGQVSIGAPHTVPEPMKVMGLNGPATSIEAGGATVCAIVNEGLRCWGLNAFGQLGNNSPATVEAPVTPLGFETGVLHVSLGQYHTCAVKRIESEQTLWCWGENSAGQLGIGTNQGPDSW